MPETPSDLTLLTIQQQQHLDANGRIARSRGITIATTPDGAAHWFGGHLPDPLVAQLEPLVAAALRENTAPEPATLDPARDALQSALGTPVALRNGPSFVFERTPAIASPATLQRSDEPLPASLRDANPGNWESAEWQDLLDGRLGPWVMALDGARVVSICHTPLPMTDAAAECGVWTHPDARGRRLAPATAAAWAMMLRPSGRHLFYATDASNSASRAVAARLALRPIGWLWQLAPEEPKDDAHPLSR